MSVSRVKVLGLAKVHVLFGSADVTCVALAGRVIHYTQWTWLTEESGSDTATAKSLAAYFVSAKNSTFRTSVSPEENLLSSITIRSAESWKDFVEAVSRLKRSPMVRFITQNGPSNR